MSKFAIETESLAKQFGARMAVSNLTLHVAQGEVFAFLGPNGAGKSTSVKMLLGLVRPSQGKAMVLGHNPGDPQVMARIGFLPEHFRFHPWLQGYELLDLHGRLYGMPSTERRRRIPKVLELVGLSEHANRPIAGFSKGMLQRIGLAQALINQPALVFLDEPTSALDPFGRILVRSIIRQLREQGTTVFLNSHLLGEVEATGDRAAFIREGRVLKTIDLHSLANGRLEVQLQLDQLPGDLHSALLQMSNSTIESITTEAGRVLCTILLENEQQIPAVAVLVISHGAKLYGLTPRRVSLEELFLDVIGHQDSGQ
jgi:ABC-2 type transport system ATP-binding protein